MYRKGGAFSLDISQYIIKPLENLIIYHVIQELLAFSLTGHDLSD